MNRINLTKTQEQFWVLNSMYPENTAYNIPAVFRLSGSPDVAILEKSLDILGERHELLRANITEADNLPFLKISEQSPEFKVPVISCNPGRNSTDIPEEIITEIHTPFNLKEDKLLRVKLFVCPDNSTFLTFVFHHIIVDLRSKEIFSEELGKIYNSLTSGEEINLPEITRTFSDYSNTYANWMGSDEAKNMLQRWQEELSQGLGPLTLPADFNRKKTVTPNGNRLNFNLGKEISGLIKEFASKNLVSPFIVLQSAYAALLHRLSGQSEFNIGVPVTNRRWENTKNIFGCFLNIVPIRISLTEKTTSAELIKHLRMKMMVAHRIQEIPMLVLRQHLKDAGTQTSPQIFEAGFTFEPLMKLNLEGLEPEPVQTERLGAQLELFLIFLEEENGTFTGTFEFASDLFKLETIGRWKEILVQIIREMAGLPDSAISGLNILPEKEKTFLEKWNDTDAPYENEICLHQKFEKQAAYTPDETALVYYDTKLSYAQLNEQANRLAHFLIDKGVEVETKIGICMQRSPEMIIAMLAILKAGGAYVPINTEAPTERVKTVSQDAELKYIFTTHDTSKNLEGIDGVIFLDDIRKNNISEKTDNPETGVHSGNLAYIMYTSGSTGKPKGVMIEHHSVMNKIGWIQKKYPMQAGESIIQKTHITFDVSVWELFWWFFNGGKLDLLKPDGEKDPASLVERIREANPFALIFVPSVFSLFVRHLKVSGQKDCLKNTRWIILIGEALPHTLVNEYNQLYEGSQAPVLVNTYGPTEATVAVSWFECRRTADTEKIYIGKPIENTKLLILNKEGGIQPIGVPGELVITGVNLARGYQNSPDLTNERFVKINLPDGSETRAYKTGDLAKWDISGELDFIGRVDNQVKIRGMRIELGDIEAKLLDHPGIKEAAVIVSDKLTENKVLLGYVVPANGKKGFGKEIRDYLEAKLPPHMIPAHFVELEKMPLTTSGKINRKLLPIPEFKSERKFVAPASELEGKLVEIWKEVLNISQASINDNFFELGGDSLLAVTLATRIQERLNIEVSVLNLMEYPNIKSFAEFVSEKDKPKNESSEQIDNRASMRKRNAQKARMRRG